VSATWVLKADGSGWAWGDVFGEPPAHVPAVRVEWIPPGTIGIFQRSNTICLLSQGRDLQCSRNWEPSTTYTPTPALADVARVGMGTAFEPYFGVMSENPSASVNYAVTGNGELWRFEATQPDVFGPATDSGTGIITASAGWKQRCAVKTDGSVWCEGQGFLGDGMDAYETPQPTRAVSLPLAAVDVVAGRDTCATLSRARQRCHTARGRERPHLRAQVGCDDLVLGQRRLRSARQQPGRERHAGPDARM